MLPYKTVSEAKAILGRTLTTTEAIWVNYSANKSDYYLYCHNIVYLVIIYSVVSLLYILAIKIFPKIEIYKIQPKVKLSISDSFICYRDVMLKFIFVVGPLQLLSYPSIKMIGIRTSIPLPSMGEIIAQLIVYFAIEDYMGYWLHRFIHCKWGYEKIHWIHHEYTSPIGFSAMYSHWADVLLQSIPSFLALVIVPCHMITMWLWFGLRMLVAIETHSGYEFPWSITKCIPFYSGAEFHDYHHFVGGQSKNNFASVFTYCDYIYGTDKDFRHKRRILEQEIIKRDGKERSL